MSPEQALSLACAAGVRFFQYRSKQGSRREIYETALRLVRIARESGALFIVNDHADIAAAVEADGVHLGQNDLPIEAARRVLRPCRLIGISTHSREQAVAAQKAGADYIGFGPLFHTATKDAGAAQGLERLADIIAAASIPVIAIGGITPDRVGSVLSAGARGAAVINAICAAVDIRAASAEMIAAMQSADNRRKP